MRTIVWVRLELEGDGDAHEAVDSALDAGELQDRINANERPFTVVSATIENPFALASLEAALKKTRRT